MVPIEVLYEDNHCIVVNKKSGDIVQGDKTGDSPLSEAVKLYLKEKYQKPGNVFCGVVHRLDRPTTGALLFARTGKALSRLNDQFKTKKVEKTYWAIIEQEPPAKEGRLEHYLVRNAKQNKSYAHDAEKKDAKRAALTYRKLLSSDRYHLLEIDLETGRHHQIRAQLSAIGCLIKGDLKYGAKRSNADGSICLHARKLIFEHPTTQEMIQVVAPVPNDPLWKWFVDEIKKPSLS